MEPTSTNEKINAKDFNAMLEILHSNFGVNKKYWIEILDLLLSKTIQVDFNLLQEAVASKNLVQTIYYAHKMQSSFKILKEVVVLTKLESIELHCGKQLVDWMKIKEELVELSKLLTLTKARLIETKEQLQKQLNQ